jgi:acetyl esterase/lipase
MLAAGGFPTASEIDPSAMRAAFVRLARAVDAQQVPIGGVENRSISGPLGPLAIRIYSPVEPNGGRLPGLLYFHGGAWVFCNLDTHDGLCRMLANESGCRVVAVGYRQAPEHKLPAAIDESYAAATWLAAHASELGIDPQRIAIGGDSAGGTLAALVCQLARQKCGPKHALQVLLCPKTDLGADTVSRRQFAKGYFFDQATLEWALRHACPPDFELTDPRFSPLRARDFSGQPPAEIHTAEFDPLRDEGKAYAERLAQAGVRVRYTCHSGMIHHFYGMAGIIRYARTALKDMGSAIREALAEPQLGHELAGGL